MSQDPLIGHTLGGARIDQRVSKGLLADVYQGFYERLNVPVAVKVLSPKAMAQGVNTDRFLREGQALAQLAHPNIIKIYNVGHEQNRYFIIMDWIQDGVNLRQLGETRPLTPAQSLKVIERLCDAMDYIHQKGLIHRDIKPANICLRRGGHPVLMDFSLIKDQSSDVQLTAPGTIMGTVNFMPPEQAQPGGPFGDVNPRSDVYSLGATLYWLLTGKPPFKGRTPMETIIKLMREEPAAPSSLNPTLPAEVDQLVLSTLSKQQPQRPATAKDLAQRIAALLVSARVELEAAQRPEPSGEDGPPKPSPSSTGSSAERAAPKASWGAGQSGTGTERGVPAVATPTPPATGRMPPATGRVPAGAPATGRMAGAPATGRMAGAPPQPAPVGAGGPAPDWAGGAPGSARRASSASFAVAAPSAEPGDAFVPATSTEGAAAGLLRAPDLGSLQAGADEPEEDDDEVAGPAARRIGTSSARKAAPARASAGRMVLYALLVLVIVVCLSVSAYVIYQLVIQRSGA